MAHMKDDDIPQAARADTFRCDCGIRLFNKDDEPMAEIVFEPGEWLDFLSRAGNFVDFR
jgi:hypothetical protein